MNNERDVDFKGAIDKDRVGMTEDEFLGYMDSLSGKGFMVRAVMGYEVTVGSLEPKLPGMNDVTEGLRRQKGQRFRTLEVISGEGLKANIEVIADIDGEPYVTSEGVNSRARYVGLGFDITRPNEELPTESREIMTTVKAHSEGYGPPAAYRQRLFFDAGFSNK
jgi:hypothetical protein